MGIGNRIDTLLSNADSELDFYNLFYIPNSNHQTSHQNKNLILSSCSFIYPINNNNQIEQQTETEGRADTRDFNNTNSYITYLVKVKVKFKVKEEEEEENERIGGKKGRRLGRKGRNEETKEKVGEEEGMEKIHRKSEERLRVKPEKGQERMGVLEKGKKKEREKRDGRAEQME